MSSRALRAATRSSPLARWQTTHVTALLTSLAGVEVDPLFVDTLGDRTQALGTPLHQLGGQGVFVKEVQAAVLDGRAEIAVHSAKDLPSTTAPGLVLSAVPERGEVRDVLIGSSLADLREGAVVGTGSVRRRAQLRAIRPDLQFVELRGNIGTRLEKGAALDAIVLAAVPLARLGIELDRPYEVLGTDVMLPMVAQGALAVECRSEDHDTMAALAAIDHAVSHRAVTAERAFLARLGSGCDLPVASLATVRPDGTLHVEGLVAAPDGSRIIRHSTVGDDPVAVGTALAEAVLADGAEALLRAER